MGTSVEGSAGSGKVVRQIIEKIQRSFARPEIVQGYFSGRDHALHRSVVILRCGCGARGRQAVAAIHNRLRVVASGVDDE